MRNRSNRPDLRNRKFMVGIATDSFRDGRQYRPEFARFSGDPEAVIGSKSEAVSLLRRRNWSCRGTVDVESDVPPPPEHYEVADSAVNREIADIDDKEHDGHMSSRQKEDLFHTLKKKRSGAKSDE